MCLHTVVLLFSVVHDPGLCDATAGAGECEEWGTAGHGPHLLLPQAAQPPSGV